MRFHLLMIAVVVMTGSIVIADDNLDESKAIAKIELLGGKVTRDGPLLDGPVIGLDFRGNKRFRNGDIQLFKAFPNLTSLNFAQARISDDELKGLGELQSLTTLDLSYRDLEFFGLKILAAHQAKHTLVRSLFQQCSRWQGTFNYS